MAVTDSRFAALVRAIATGEAAAIPRMLAASPDLARVQAANGASRRNA